MSSAWTQLPPSRKLGLLSVEYFLGTNLHDIFFICEHIIYSVRVAICQVSPESIMTLSPPSAPSHPHPPFLWDRVQKWKFDPNVNPLKFRDAVLGESNYSLIFTVCRCEVKYLFTVPLSFFPFNFSTYFLKEHGAPLSLSWGGGITLHDSFCVTRKK